MRIDSLFTSGKPTISFEFFPPKTEAGFASLYQTIDDLHPLHPSYVSVTYGAGGSTRRGTVDLVRRIQNDLKIRAMAHLTCVDHTAEQIGGILDELWNGGIVNVLTLRGDAPAGQAQFTATSGGFAYASDLVKFAKARHDFSIGVAGYPEGHPQCLNRTRDLEMLKLKIDNGGRFVVTQLFFDNADFYRFRDAAGNMGINVPIIAGIMPITNAAQLKKFVAVIGAKIPHPLLQKLETIESDPAAVASLGVDYAIAQCRDLLKNGISGIHFYTLNKSKATVQIVQSLSANHAY
jgi:methylenetetrahydrofolate reductase (NADPH)